MSSNDDLFKLLDFVDSIENNETTNESVDNEFFDILKNMTEVKIENKKQCRECNSENIFKDKDEGYLTCLDCGLRLEELVDNSPEWRFYGSADNKQSDPTRCGSVINPLLPKSSMGTIIAGRGNYNMKKLHGWNTMPYKERSLWLVFNIIQNNCINGDLPVCISDVAKVLYKDLSEKIISRGKVRKSLIACCVYFACKKKNVARSDKEIADLFKLNIREMSKGQKKFRKIFSSFNDMEDNFTPTRPVDFIPRFCSKLMINENHKTIVEKVIEISIEYRILLGSTPPSVVAGSIFYVSDHYKLGISKKKIAKECFTSEVTITKMYKKLLVHNEKFVSIL
jgi:transcription initiation factor TFIIB